MDEFPHGILAAWSFPVWPAIGLLIAGALYLRGWRALQRTRARDLPVWRAVCSFAGLVAIWIALASPIDALDDYLLSAHMLQHFILMSIAPPLLVLGAPLVPMLRGLPRWLIRGLRPVFASRGVHKVAHGLARPVVAWLAMNIAYLGWHVPQAFELTLRSEGWHNTEHMCFLFTSIAFWWVVVEPWPSRTAWSRWMVIPYLLTADVVNTILSAVLTFSGKVLYPSYAAAERISTLTPLKDQVLAGAEMWVLNSIVFLVPVAVLVVKLLSPRGLREDAALTNYAGS
ncbi:MAG TPA: cytochrome c oxidase assembly protein [Acidobacteriaceae bacterium]|nr:cytochrome c oxidase assembly protein [Acidobacteriaceae bacterium]